MAGIVIPTNEKLPPGPRRDLVEALHGLYRGAGKPSLRDISDGIKRRDALPTTVSHDTASQLLNGVTVPSWARVESMVRYLAETAVGRQKPDPEGEVERFHRLWLAADDAEPAGPAEPSTADEALRADLRSADPERRIAALYRLERLAWRASPEEQTISGESWRSVLTDFLQEACPRAVPPGPPRTPREDVQLALLVLGRLPGRYVVSSFALAGLDLRTLVWDGAWLWDADLSGSLLSNGSLQSTQLVSARLVEATLVNVDLCFADLTMADLTRCDLSGATMAEVNISEADLSYAVLSGTHLADASARSTRLDGCTAERAVFSDADLRRAGFKGAVLTDCQFDRATLTGADLTGAKLSGVSFSGADLSRARFTESSLDQVQLTRTQRASIKVVPDSD
ncbi:MULTISPECIES: pentapeptide repeat-containing protein [unclassified Kitasatospora]